jgi:glycosyltransferase involved in cell wall biosynthesis
MVLAAAFKDKLLAWGVKSPVELVTTTVNVRLLDNFDVEEKMVSIVSDGSVKVLYMARLEHEKGVVDVLNAVLDMLKTGANISLTIAGDGPAMNEIREIMEDNKELNTHIDIVGDIRGEEKSKLLKTHHIFCFPTMYPEGMPISVLEAMSFGMPVITCAVGGLRDFFVDGKMGYMSENRDINSIKSALQGLLDDRSRLVEMGRYNYRYGQEHFLSTGAEKRLLEKYRAIMLAG